MHFLQNWMFPCLRKRAIGDSAETKKPVNSLTFSVNILSRSFSVPWRFSQTLSLPTRSECIVRSVPSKPLLFSWKKTFCVHSATLLILRVWWTSSILSMQSWSPTSYARKMWVFCGWKCATSWFTKTVWFCSLVVFLLINSVESCYCSCGSKWGLNVKRMRSTT